MGKRMIIKEVAALAAGIVLVAVCAGKAAVDEPAPYGVTPSSSQLQWQAMEFYGFLHFTVNTFTDREWGDGSEKESVFNPTDFSARQIVETARKAGMKGLILTCKHHDGFCLWPSDYTEHSVKNSPYKDGKGDIVREISDECHKQGLKFGVYLSPWDRNSAYYGKAEYITYYRNQLKELLTKYGPIFEVWLDGANGGTGYYGGANERRNIDRQTYYDWPTTWDLIHRLQPYATIFSDVGPGCRWVGNEHGVAGDPCWATITYPRLNGKLPMPGSPINRQLLAHGTRNGRQWAPAECDVSIRPGWFYHKSQDSRVKSAQELLDIYYKSIGRGGTLLLNLPPDRRGRIPEEDVKSLMEFRRLLDETFAENLARKAVLQASNVRGRLGEFAPVNMLDGNRESYWASDEAVTTPEVTFSFGKPITFNVVDLRENIRLGQRVDGWGVDFRRAGKWVEFAKGTAIGARRLWRGNKPITTDAVRLRITKAPICPAISEFGLYLEPPDAKEAARNSVAKKNAKGWKVVTASFQVGGNAVNAIDGNPKTLWHTHDGKSGEHAAPQYIVVDMLKEHLVAGFEYVPRSDGCPNGIVDQYAFYVSRDGKSWGNPVAEGEFANILNNPVRQEIMLKTPAKARFYKFVAQHSASANHISVAEIKIIEK